MVNGWLPHKPYPSLRHCRPPCPRPASSQFLPLRLSPSGVTSSPSHLQTGRRLLWALVMASSCAPAACWYQPTPTAWTDVSVLARSAGPAPTPSFSTAMTMARPGSMEASCPTCAQASASWLQWMEGRLAVSSTAMPGAPWAAVCRRSAQTRAPPSCLGNWCPPWPRLPVAARAASWASQPRPLAGLGMWDAQWDPRRPPPFQACVLESRHP